MLDKIDDKILDKVLLQIVNEVGGDWVLVGASVLLAVDPLFRATQDIDLVDISKDEGGAVERLTKVILNAKTLGLTPDHINGSAGFFLRQIKGWEKFLVLMKSTKEGRVYRPDANLYLALKLKRGTDIDVEDSKIALKMFPGEFNEMKFFALADQIAKLRYKKQIAT